MTDQEKFFSRAKQLEELRLELLRDRAKLDQEIKKLFKKEFSELAMKEGQFESGVKRWLKEWFEFKDGEQFSFMTIAQKTFTLAQDGK